MAIHPSKGPERTNNVRLIALISAAMISLMLVAQLFNYENFANTLGDVLPFNDQPFTISLAAAIVLLELLALPYLLGMYISKLLRVVSALCFVAISVFWIVITFTNAHATNAALFSTTIQLSGGLLPAIWSIVLAVCGYITISNDTKFRHDSPTDLR